MSPWIRGFLALPLTLAAVVSTAHADSYYLTLKGQKTGAIKGSVIQKGREGSIQVVDISHSIVVPREQGPGPGASAVRREHRPLVVTIALDQSAPQLYNSLCTVENITQLDLSYWSSRIRSAVGTGAESLEFTVRLTNCQINSIDQVVEKEQNGISHTYLRISFSYQKIEWTWLNGGITASDELSAPR